MKQKQEKWWKSPEIHFLDSLLFAKDHMSFKIATNTLPCRTCNEQLQVVVVLKRSANPALITMIVVI